MKQDFSLPPAPKRPLGEVNIWLASIGLSLGLIMIFGLLGIIVFNGLEAFWPKTCLLYTSCAGCSFWRRWQPAFVQSREHGEHARLHFWKYSLEKS